MSAVDRVFGVTELAEGILKHLPVYDLLLATTVSKHWEQVICNSAQIHSQLASATLPKSARGFPGRPESFRLCNYQKDASPWLLEVEVTSGKVLVLRTLSSFNFSDLNIQIYVPNDKQTPLIVLDGTNTRLAIKGAFAECYYHTSLWMYFFAKNNDEPVAWIRRCLDSSTGFHGGKDWTSQTFLTIKYLEEFHVKDVSAYMTNYRTACWRNKRELPFSHRVHGAELDMACKGLDAMALRNEIYDNLRRLIRNPSFFGGSLSSMRQNFERSYGIN